MQHGGAFEETRQVLETQAQGNVLDALLTIGRPERNRAPQLGRAGRCPRCATRTTESPCRAPCIER